MEDPGLFETMFSLRSMRRLKTDPIPPDVLKKNMTAGTQDSTGQNTQPWAFLA
ncbi:MAG: nitroreductase family protein, partial [Rhodospirillales bacterium]|nr:nitroreductase family protein [Rhodospirillales bacterium]